MHGWSKIFGTNIGHSSCYVILHKKTTCLPNITKVTCVNILLKHILCLKYKSNATGLIIYENVVI